MMRMPGLAMPVLGVLGLEPETMGWGTQPDDVLRVGARRAPGSCRSKGVGHFVHIEQPDLVAALVLDFLGDPPPAPDGGWALAPPSATGSASPSLGRVRRAEPDPAHDDARPPPRPPRPPPAPRRRRRRHGRPLLLLHGLGEQTPADGAAVRRRVARTGLRPRLHRPRRRRPSRPAAATRPRSCWPTPTPPSPTSARSPWPAAASAPTSPCCWPAPGPTSCGARCCSTARA